MISSVSCPYKILGINSHATLDEIRRAYRREMLRHHPDRHGNSPESLEQTLRLTQAYEVLKNRKSGGVVNSFVTAVRGYSNRRQNFGGLGQSTMRAYWGSMSF